MTEKLNLKNQAIFWLQNYALEVLGPCEVNVKDNEEAERSTISIILSGEPPVISEDSNYNFISSEIHENISIYLDIIQNNFIEVLIYLHIDIASEKYNYACELANYINSQSNSSHVQIFDQDEDLIIRIKVSSSASLGADNEDFKNLILSNLCVCYYFYELFLILSESHNHPNDIIDIFNSKVSGIDSHTTKLESANLHNDEDEDEDELIRTQVDYLNTEFIKILDSLEDSDYWTEKLDYSINSLSYFDQLITDLWPNEGPSENNIETITAIFGSYVAVSLMEKFNGHWSVGDKGAWIFNFSVNDDYVYTQVKPFVWMSNKFHDNELISKNYELFISPIR
jgi:hypothetical protein